MLFQKSVKTLIFRFKCLKNLSLDIHWSSRNFSVDRKAILIWNINRLQHNHNFDYSFLCKCRSVYFSFIYLSSWSSFEIGSKNVARSGRLSFCTIIVNRKSQKFLNLFCQKNFSSLSQSNIAKNLTFHPSTYFRTPDDASLFLKHFSRDESVMRWAIGSMSPKNRRKLMRRLFEEIEKDTRDPWLPGGSSSATNSSTYSEKSQADQIFVSLDLNQDGQVTQREFRTWYNLHFKPSFTHEKSTSQNDSVELHNESISSIDDASRVRIASSSHVVANMQHQYYEQQSLNYDSLKNSDEDDEELPLTKRQVFLVLFRSSIPYLGFGFMDNCLMLLFGEMIDKHLGVILHLTTLGAAGYGNMMSCATGVVAGGFIERISYRLGLPSPNLTSDQADSKSVKNLHLLGSVIGICIGCLVGMFPLLLLEHKHHKEINSTVNTDA